MLKKNSYNVGILGASGAVGTQMLISLSEQKFPINNLRVFGSKKSAGKTVYFKDKSFLIEDSGVANFDDLDIVLSAVDNDIAKQIIPKIVKAGAIVIDNSSAYRLSDDVPLVVADVNDEDILSNKGIIANPNCATIIALLCLAPLHRYAKIKRVVASTYQAASGAGNPGIDELNNQITSIATNTEIPAPYIFCDQLAMNLIPQIGNFNDNCYTTEEMKMQCEGAKILHDSNIKISCTCVRVPILRSHSESITVDFEDDISPAKAIQILRSAEGVRVIDNKEADVAKNRYPMPLYTSNQDLVYVGRIRSDISSPTPNKSLSFWCTGDQIRIGAASNAVKIANKLISI